MLKEENEGICQYFESYWSSVLSLISEKKISATEAGRGESRRETRNMVVVKHVLVKGIVHTVCGTVSV